MCIICTYKQVHKYNEYVTLYIQYTYTINFERKKIFCRMTLGIIYLLAMAICQDSTSINLLHFYVPTSEGINNDDKIMASFVWL